MTAPAASAARCTGDPRRIVTLKACPRCAYDLSHRPAHGRCPECGLDATDCVFDLPVVNQQLNKRQRDVTALVVLLLIFAAVAGLMIRGQLTVESVVALSIGGWLAFLVSTAAYRAWFRRTGGHDARLVFATRGIEVVRDGARPSLWRWPDIRRVRLRRHRLRPLWHTLTLTCRYPLALVQGPLSVDVRINRREAALVRRAIRELHEQATRADRELRTGVLEDRDCENEPQRHRASSCRR